MSTSSQRNQSEYFLTIVNRGTKTASNKPFLQWRLTPYDDDFHALQREVDGCFELCQIFEPWSDKWVQLYQNLRINTWVNDEGKLDGLPMTWPLISQNQIVDVLVGNICFTLAGDGGESYGLPIGLANEVMTIVSEFARRKFGLTIEEP